VLALILGGGKGTRLYPLTRGRSKPAVPFCGNYRIIDIPISNCINSGLNRVFVLTQYNSASLNRHIIQTYKFDVFHDGFVDILASEQTMEANEGGFSEGTADAVRKSIKHLRDIRDIKHVIVMAGDQLYRMNFRDMTAAHIDSGADVTLGVLPVCEEDLPRFGILNMHEDGRVSGFVEKPKSAEPVRSWTHSSELLKHSCRGKSYIGSMGIYMFNIDALVEVLMDKKEMLDFGREVIPYCIEKYRVNGFIHDDYWEDIGTIRSYHRANIELAQERPVFNFYEPCYPFFSMPRFLPPSKVVSTRLENVILSDGTILEDCDVKSSVIGIRCVIRKGCTIENSVLIGADFYETDEDRYRNRVLEIPDVGIGRDCVIRNAIVDKNCRIGNGVRIVNERGIKNASTDRYSIVDGIVVVPKNTVIPDGTEI
jgi:glucose-1-phosphate adenylyltransferase